MGRLGIIGKPSDWLISCETNKKTVKERFGIELVDIDIEDVYQIYMSLYALVCPLELRDDKFSEEEFNKAYRLYVAIDKVLKKNDLEGFTIRCFDLLSKIKTTSCLALSLFNKQHITASCEGDVPALISMYLVEKMMNESSFQANPSRIDVDDNSMVLAHCTLPMNMCTSYKYDTHYESGIGIAIKGELKQDDVFVFRINKDMTKYALLKGKIISNLHEKTLCRTQIEIKFDANSDVSYFLRKPLGNHHVVFYASNCEKLDRYLTKCGLEKI